MTPAIRRHYALAVAFTLLVLSTHFTASAGAHPGAGDCGLALDASVSGSGPTHIVLIGGLSASPEEWDTTRERLQADHTVHVVSVPGLGGSPLSGKACDVDIPALAAALGRYIERSTGSTRPVVIGHSAGGLATLQLAGVRGELLSGIVVIDALPFMSANFGATTVNDALQESTHEEYRQILSESQAQFLDRLRAQLQRSVQDASTASRIAAAAADSDRRTYASLYSSTMLTDLRGLHVAPATYVIFADQRSNGAPPGFMRARYAGQYAWLPADHLLEVEDARHYVMLDQPPAFLGHLEYAIRAILDGSGQAQSTIHE